MVQGMDLVMDLIRVTVMDPVMDMDLAMVMAGDPEDGHLD